MRSAPRPVLAFASPHLRGRSPLQEWTGLKHKTTSHLGLCHKRHPESRITQGDWIAHLGGVQVYCFLTNWHLAIKDMFEALVVAVVTGRPGVRR
jgi:hypothetical protein